VPDVDAVVDTETNRDDDVNAGHDVDGDVPEVKVANNVNQSDAHHQHYHEADLYVSQEDESDQEDTAEAQANISPDFCVDNLVSLPGEIDLVEGDGARQTTGAQEFLYGSSSRSVL